MKIVTFKQKSNEWLEWRRQGIGASDAPIVLGLSKYMKPHKLWMIKRGLSPEQRINAYVEERAQKVENAARAWIEMEMGYNYPASCAESVKYPWMKASLDGWCYEIQSAMEAKWVTAEALGIKIPAGHWIQMQHQMAVYECDDIIYCPSNDGINFYPRIVNRNQPYIDMMIGEEERFMEMVKAGAEPDDERRPAGWAAGVDDSIERWRNA